MKKSLEYLRDRKANGEKIVMLTCYDYPTAVWEDEAGVDIVFVGDSVGTNVLGYETPQEVTMDDMVHHLKAVRRGVNSAYLLVDMPYRSYETADQALENALIFASKGADGVKIEGAGIEVVRHLGNSGIEVCSHLGLTPQTDEKPGLRAKSAADAAEIVRDALELERAGASMLVFETIPEEVARYATEKISVPTIGIGAGRFTDGQVLVVLDMLGINAFDFRHNRRYDLLGDRAIKAIRSYAEEVRLGRFPAEENLRHMAEDELREFLSLVNLNPA